MYLKSIALTNFRQFGTSSSGGAETIVYFNENFNVLVGENDSGKTAIIDAIRYLLGSVSDDFERITDEDFHYNSDGEYSDSFYIEGIFHNLTREEAGAFLEWLSIDDENNYELRISLAVKKVRNDNEEEYIKRIVKAGEKEYESRLSGSARNLLKTTYLKPLRDANLELRPGFRSRLAQILKSHPIFKGPDASGEKLVEIMEQANKQIEDFFEDDYDDNKSLTKDIELLLKDFYDTADRSKSRSKFTISKTDLHSILRKLSLDTEDINLGLGNLNLLFIAAELLLLNTENQATLIGPQITLIEEIEAHLHPQAQIRLIKFLEKELNKNNNKSQFILTSHSTNLVASIDPKNIILIHKKNAYPLNTENTKLEDNDYKFLERFLDSTKSNLFFAKSLIFVEGVSEMLLLPVLAELIGFPLHKHGISLINVDGTSFERYIKLFSRSEYWREELKFDPIDIPISVVTDIDVKPNSYYEFEKNKEYVYVISDIEELKEISNIVGDDDILDNDQSIGQVFSTYKKLTKKFKLSITSENEDEILNIIKEEKNEEFIKIISDDKIDNLTNKYSGYDANLEVCLAPEWTLEYSLALSVLAPYLLESIHETRYKNPYEGEYKENFDDMYDQLMGSTIPRDKIAYQIFKPLNDSNVSKAEVAQLMAVKLNDILKDSSKAEELKEEILGDDKLIYLVNAICFAATGKISVEGGVISE